jgi:hypothetical protein
VLVHLITIGWLSLTMCGALSQFIPVLTERPLNSDRLPLPALAFLTAVWLPLSLAFFGWTDACGWNLPFLSVAALLLGVGFRARDMESRAHAVERPPLSLPARFVAMGLAAVSVATTLG